MTVLAGCIALLMTAALGWGIGAVGGAAVRDARAQMAADAAALAAVAESAPGGSGQPEAQARRFAAANGARVLECLCAPGSSAMQVRVAVGDAAATARAVFDADLLVPLGPEGAAGSDGRSG